jgi:hypothetical protein
MSEADAAAAHHRPRTRRSNPRPAASWQATKSGARRRSRFRVSAVASAPTAVRATPAGSQQRADTGP